MRIFFIIVLSFFASVNSYSEDKIFVGNFFNENEREEVLEGGIITKCFLKYKGGINTSNADSAIEIPWSKYIPIDLKSYEFICIEKAFFAYKLSANSGIALYNILAAPSKLKGTKYYSKTGKEVQTFITDCFRIDSEAHQNHIEDAVYGAVIPKTLYYFKITDNRLGNLIFRSELYNEGNNFVLKNVCVQPIEKYLIRVNKKEEYQTISFFIYAGKSEGFFYCSVNAMRIRSDYFLKLGILTAESFANRVRGSTVNLAKLLGLNWMDKIKAFE